MNKRYGVVLIGCGHIGQEHIEDIYFRDNIRVVATVDTREEQARLFARRYGADHYGTDYRPFLRLPETDIVIIATYVNTHLSILRDCLEAGKHVLCEKPIAGTLEEGEAFYRLVKGASSQVLVAHILRHNRTYQTAARLIGEGAVGRLALMRMVQNHHAMDWPRYKRLMADCPPIVDCGVHYIDVMQWFSGSRVVEVSGVGCCLDADSGQDNYGMIQARLANGCIASYEAGWSRNLAAQNLKEFIGDKGRLTITLRDNRITNKEEGDCITLYTSDTGEYRTINVAAKYKDMYAQLSAHIGMIEGKASASPSIDEVYSAFVSAMTAKKAIETRTVQFVPALIEGKREKGAS